MTPRHYPTPHKPTRLSGHFPARPSALDDRLLQSARCARCGRTLYIDTERDTLRCPWHGELLIREIAIPARPRKQNQDTPKPTELLIFTPRPSETKTTPSHQ